MTHAPPRVWPWVLATVLVALPAVDAAWLESRGDAARTGRVDGLAPTLNETAFVRDLGSPRALASTPILLKGNAFLLTQDLQGEPGYPEVGRDAVWRLNLSSGRGANEPFYEFERRPTPVAWPTLVSDGERLYVLRTGRVDAVDPETGRGHVVWQRDPRVVVPSGDEWSWVCNPPTWDDEVLYIGCIESSGRWDPEAGQYMIVEALSFVAALSRSADGSLTEVWSRVVPPSRPYDADGLAADPDLTDACQTLEAPGINAPARSSACANPVLLLGHSVIGGLVVAVVAYGAPLDVLTPRVTPVTNEAVILEGALVAFERTTGNLRWTRHHPLQGTAEAALGSRTQDRMWDRVLKVEVTGGPEVIFSREPDLVLLNPDDGRRSFEPIPVNDGETIRTATAPGFALSGRDLYTSSEQHLWRFDTHTRERTGRTQVPLPNGEFFVMPDLAVAGDLLFAKSARLEETASGGWGRFVSASNHLHAFDTSSDPMTRRWSYAFGGGYSPNILWLAFGVGEGVLVAQGLDGTVTVIGSTPASVRVEGQVGPHHPEVGDPVRVDLSGSQPGVDGPPTRFRVDWGDGSASAWTSDPVFHHAYAERRDVTLVAWAANDAGQTASRSFVVRVGYEEKQGVLLAELFAPENQETTYFVLGLLVMGAGAALGTARLRRRRRILRAELAAVEAAARDRQQSPEGVERVLAARRGRAQSLWADGHISDAEHEVLLHRIRESVARVRLSALEGPLAFLPYGIVRELRHVLEDGTLHRAEHRRVLELVRRDRLLSPLQKRRARARLDAWRARDAS